MLTVTAANRHLLEVEKRKKKQPSKQNVKRRASNINRIPSGIRTGFQGSRLE